MGKRPQRVPGPANGERKRTTSPCAVRAKVSRNVRREINGVAAGAGSRVTEGVWL